MRLLQFVGMHHHTHVPAPGSGMAAQKKGEMSLIVEKEDEGHGWTDVGSKLSFETM